MSVAARGPAAESARTLLRLGTIALALLPGGLFPAGRLDAAEVREKKLIEFGWDEPDTAFLRAHLAEMEKTPFDGCVYHADASKHGGGKGGSLTWDSWGKRSFSEEEFVWIYSETPRWWSKEGKPVKLPEEYVTALREARRGLAAD